MMKIMKWQGAIDDKGRLSLEVPTFLRPGPVDVVMVIQPQREEEPIPPRYDFSALIGQLAWQGDALTAQKELRHEWE
ncbi:MAG: hypothetical protein AB1656_02605 [Candidatus Omnitrophota bacterium]